ncbi:glucose-6-phosphate 1-dehydrogenase [Pseudonocardia sediminis]|uniref:Glucose-6-phosphate 1-dehydrogenase n=1 Tax=Pseudonocardia sediminis TaxID=1397368 RepID=A0A4Q7UZN5_PSEST|nr:glucose-6-phosphate dehydrogenase [Pseudonocardia sediminis]RZT86588.1 glucose-6-phosphate 1-dehydrogenase [Pseudonocardia sediminis]
MPNLPVMEPADIVVFGGTGDLAMRKLLPALYLRDRDGQLDADTRIVAVSRSGLDDADYRDKVDSELRRTTPAWTGSTCESDEVHETFLRRLHHVTLDVADDDWSALADLLGPPEGRIRVLYLASAPKLFGRICVGSHAHGIVDDASRVVLEKPLGTDLASAQAINDEVGSVFSEEQIYRIDHYLGKETVQNLLVLRFGNSLFEPLWNAGQIDHVQITVAESIGVGGRADYYDGSGAMRDMVQNHLLQLLCLVAMEPPARIDGEGVRDEKLKVLQSLRPLVGPDVVRDTVRGQYTEGLVDGTAVPGYGTELAESRAGTPNELTPSDTETFVALRAEVANWRWAGVPFYLRTGKRLARHASEIVVQFKPVPHSIFPSFGEEIPPNRLVLRLQPDEGVRLHMTAKQPGPGGIRPHPAALDLSFARTFGDRLPDAYERLLMDVLRGNPTLFMRRDEIEAAWRWAEPVLNTWAETDQKPRPYSAGGHGPASATYLIERDGRAWHEDY